MSEQGVYAAIAAVTEDLGKRGIAKERKNQQQGYAFRGIDDVYNALNAALAEHKLCVLPRVLSRSQEERVTHKGTVMYSVVVHVEYDIVHADGSSHTVSVYGEAMDTADKATNKAMSAAYKYMAMQVFCIPTIGIHEDADSTTPEPTRPKPKQHPLDILKDRLTGCHSAQAVEEQARRFWAAAEEGKIRLSEQEKLSAQDAISSRLIELQGAP